MPDIWLTICPATCRPENSSVIPTPIVTPTNVSPAVEQQIVDRRLRIVGQFQGLQRRHQCRQRQGQQHPHPFGHFVGAKHRRGHHQSRHAGEDQAEDQRQVQAIFEDRVHAWRPIGRNTATTSTEC